MKKSISSKLLPHLTAAPFGVFRDSPCKVILDRDSLTAKIKSLGR